jgi:hypothetical protein
MTISVDEKTVTLNGEPGDRIGGIDEYGFCYDRITYRFAGNDKLHDAIIANIRALKLLRGDHSDSGFLAYEEGLEKRSRLIDQIMELPIYRSKRVFVGFSY